MLLAKLLMAVIFAALVGTELAVAAAFTSRVPLTIAQLASVARARRLCSDRRSPSPRCPE
jgi:hypothetical protein